MFALHFYKKRMFGKRKFKKKSLFKSLRGNPLPPIPESNHVALIEGVRWNKPNYKFQCVKAQNKEFTELYQRYPYFGIVDIKIQDIPNFLMLSYNDDFVAKTYFFYGANSYEGLSVYLFSQLAKEAGTVFDVGAYTGLFSLVASCSNAKSKIYAYEPVAAIADRISDNVKLNGVQNISVCAKAVSDSERKQILNMYGYSGSTTGSSIAIKKNKNIFQSVEVDVVTLDSELDRHADSTNELILVKLDTEKDEINALKGSFNLLKKDYVALLVEVLDDDQLAQVIDYLFGFEYAVGYIDEKNANIFWLSQDAMVTDSSKPADLVGSKFSINQIGYGNLIAVSSKLGKSRIEEIVHSANAKIYDL